MDNKILHEIAHYEQRAANPLVPVSQQVYAIKMAASLYLVAKRGGINLADAVIQVYRIIEQRTAAN